MVVYYKKYYKLQAVKTTFNELCKMLGLNKKESIKIKKQLKKGTVHIYIPRRKPIAVSKVDISYKVGIDYGNEKDVTINPVIGCSPASNGCKNWNHSDTSTRKDGMTDEV
jgi:hypothetical protein